MSETKPHTPRYTKEQVQHRRASLKRAAKRVGIVVAASAALVAADKIVSPQSADKDSSIMSLLKSGNGVAIDGTASFAGEVKFRSDPEFPTAPNGEISDANVIYQVPKGEVAITSFPGDIKNSNSGDEWLIAMTPAGRGYVDITELGKQQMDEGTELYTITYNSPRQGSEYSALKVDERGQLVIDNNGHNIPAAITVIQPVEDTYK